MKLQTPVPVERQEPALNYHSEVVLLGSCFVEHIGEKLEYFNFPSLANPFGVIFNPYSIANLIDRAVNRRFFTEEDSFFSNGRWHCFEVHSQGSHANREVFVNGLNRGLQSLRDKLEKATHLVVTLGTAWVYRHRELGRIVANCHKQPQKIFEKELLGVKEIILQFERIDHLVKSINPACTVIVTVSPVRHIKDGLVENQRSKAHLITAVHYSLESTLDWRYFPSYEILMDELRDYRFYANDMLHPSSLAVEVVWKRFAEAWLEDSTAPVMKRVDRIRKALRHKPFDPEGDAHRELLKKTGEEIDVLKREYPHMRFPPLS